MLFLSLETIFSKIILINTAPFLPMFSSTQKQMTQNYARNRKQGVERAQKAHISCNMQENLKNPTQCRLGVMLVQKCGHNGRFSGPVSNVGRLEGRDFLTMIYFCFPRSLNKQHLVVVFVIFKDH